MKKQDGFTLVELLVVITIIGVLVSLLLPAVQAAREAARRLECSNNIRQLGLAVRNYSANRNSLPAAGIVAPGSSFNPKSGNMFSWIVLILPFLEQQNLHDDFDFSRTVLDQPNEPQAVQVGTLLCASDSAKGLFYSDASHTSGKKFAKANFAAFASPFHVDLSPSYPGALAGNKNQTLAHVRDGASNTMLISEVRTRGNNADQRGAWALPWAGASLLSFDMHHLGAADAVFTHHPGSLGVTQPPNNQGPNLDMLYGCPDAAGAQLERMPCGDAISEGWISAAPRSNHPGGVNVVFLDGHIGFIPDSVDEIAMAYLISINDGQPVSPGTALP